MNATSSALLGAALIVAAADWLAVFRRNKTLEHVCKPAAAALFLLVAVGLDPAQGPSRWWLVAALGFCIAGDVFLMLPRDAFVPGLASFAVAQVLFTVSFAVRDISAVRLIIGSVIVVTGSALLARRFIGALTKSRQSSLIAPIVVYMVAISAMVVGSIAAGTVIAVLGAVLFLVSDALIAEQRFVSERRWQPVTIIVTYHLALAGLVLGAA